MKRVTLPSQPLLAVLGEVDAGEDADRRAEQRRQRHHQQRAEDRVGQAARRRPAAAASSREERQRQAADAEAHRLDQDPDSQNRPNAIAASDSVSATALTRLRRRALARARRSVVSTVHRCSCSAPSPFFSCASSSFESASTTKVMRNRIRPRSISDAWCRPWLGLGELVGERRGDAVGRPRTATAC